MHTLVSQPDRSDDLSIALTPKKQKEVEAVTDTVVQFPPRDQYMRDVQKEQYNARYKSSFPPDRIRPQTPPAGNSSPWSAFSDEEVQSSHSGFLDGNSTDLGAFDDNFIDNSTEERFNANSTEERFNANSTDFFAAFFHQ